MVRAKFRVYEKTETETKQDGNTGYRVKLTPVQSEQFGKYTPIGTMEMLILNDEASKQLEVGKEYYIDLTPVE
jgi:hypothetical protein